MKDDDRGFSPCVNHVATATPPDGAPAGRQGEFLRPLLEPVLGLLIRQDNLPLVAWFKSGVFWVPLLATLRRSVPAHCADPSGVFLQPFPGVFRPIPGQIRPISGQIRAHCSSTVKGSHLNRLLALPAFL